MPKLYTRNQGGNIRYYADLRDIGGGQVALKPPGSRRATTDKTEAMKLLGFKIEELQTRPNVAAAGLLGPFAERFIKRNPGQVTDRWLHDTELRLGKAVEFFGYHRELDSIKPRHLRDWLDRDLSKLAPGTQRHYLHALSALYKYAREQEAVPSGYGPVSDLGWKPQTRKERQRTDEFFEIDEAAAFLDVAHRLDAYPELVATFLLTGARRTEGFGLLIGDIDLENGLVRIQPNRYRGLKRAWSERVVPLWPQLDETLRPYLATRGSDPNQLLFPGLRGMLTDLRKPLRAISKALGIETPRLTKFRHTYATARLQTTDNGKQISLWTVAKELGHKNVSRVEDTYGHPSHYRPRGETVEYHARDPQRD
jgi:integrase